MQLICILSARVRRIWIKQQLGIKSFRLPELRTHIIVKRRKPGWIRCAFQRFEVQLPYVHAIPVEPLQQNADMPFYLTMAFRILEVHELSPVELRILSERRFFAPLWMIRPNLFADMRQFQPCINKNGIAMAS